jgi:hypothetical protein
MIDFNQTGNITVEALRSTAQYFSGKTDIPIEEVYNLHRLLDYDKDGLVTIQDFLISVGSWLSAHDFITPRPRLDIVRSNFEKSVLHMGVAGLLSLGYVVHDFDRTEELYIEDRVWTWDYFGAVEIPTG